MEIEEYGVFAAVFAGHVALSDEARAPAAAIAFVFRANQDFKRFLGLDFVVVTCDGVKVFTDGPLRRQIDLADFIVEIVAVRLQVNAFVAAVFVTRAQYFARLGIVADGRGVAFGAAFVLVVVDIEAGMDAVAQFAVREADPIGLAAFITADAAVQQYVVVFEIKLLSDAGTEQLGTVVWIEESGLRGGGQAVGGVDAVVTDVQVFTEKLVVREAVFRGVEIG